MTDQITSALVARVLRRGGHAFISYFVLNDESRDHMASSAFDFQRVDERYAVKSEKDPEAAIAYDESFIASLHDEAGVPIVLPVHYGDWSGRAGEVGGQDVVVAQKVR